MTSMLRVLCGLTLWLFSGIPVMGFTSRPAAQQSEPVRGDERNEGQDVEEEQEESASNDTIRNRRRFTSATTLYQRKDYAAAASKLRECLAQDPRYSNAAKLLGLCLIELGDHDAAAETVLHAYNLDPQDSQLGILLARIHRDREHYTLANAFLDQVELSAGWTPSLALERLALARAQDDSESAVTVLMRWARKTESVRPYRLLLEEYRSQEQWDSALAVAQKLADMQPKDRNAAVQVFHVLREAGRWQEATAHLEALASSRPGDPTILDMLRRHRAERPQDSDHERAPANRVPSERGSNR